MATLNLISKWIRQPIECQSCLNMYTKTLSARLKERNIDVNSIHPG
jgi:hypothetical protein